MKTTYFGKSLLIASLGCVLAFAVACGDDDDSSNPAPNGGTKNNGGSGGSNTVGGDDTGGKNTVGGTKPTGGTSNQTEGGAGAGPVMMNEGGVGGEATCTDDADNGCYKCKPSTHEQFLNQCPTTGCEPFDNTKLTSIKNGKLPDLP
ncbi:MAG TPA: hypothetical protein VHB79_22960 [Polyangiaceae bacterium]|nr:hypothetical protein [Polyangiaceae bacterium]